VIMVTEDSTAAERFRALPQVQSVSREGSQLTIRGVGGDLVTHVIQCLAEYGIRVIDFRTDRPTLEDVFLKLTGHMIRD
jgi:ABC-2 type transport system ATP-binding protein